MRRCGRTVLSLACLVGAVACSNSPQPPPICNEPEIPVFQLLYPIPSATSVPIAAGSLVFAGSPDSEVNVVLTPASGAALSLGALVAPPSPLPSPMATPSLAGSALSSAPYPALTAATSYTVSYKIAESGPCGNASATAGVFTTQ